MFYSSLFLMLYAIADFVKCIPMCPLKKSCLEINKIIIKINNTPVYTYINLIIA